VSPTWSPTRTAILARPVFARGVVRVSDVLDRFWAGADLDSLAEDFSVSRAALEDVVRAALPTGCPTSLSPAASGILRPRSSG
jgi:hypothetical protein